MLLNSLRQPLVIKIVLIALMYQSVLFFISTSTHAEEITEIRTGIMYEAEDNELAFRTTIDKEALPSEIKNFTFLQTTLSTGPYDFKRNNVKYYSRGSLGFYKQPFIKTAVPRAGVWYILTVLIDDKQNPVAYHLGSIAATGNGSMNAPTSNEPIAKPSTPVPNQVSADKPDPAIPFSDVNLNHWAKDYIQNMTARKAIEGYPDGKFKPDNTVTRAEFAKIMVVSAGLKPLQPTSSSYADVGTSDWFLSYIEAAKSYLTGFLLPDGQLTYQPNSPALREDIAIAIVKLKGYDRTHKPDSAKLQSTFSDYNSISATARNYVSIAVETGLINGFDDKTFRAQEPITRSQAAALLWRAFQFGSDNKVELKSGTVTNATYGSPTVTQSTYGN